MCLIIAFYDPIVNNCSKCCKAAVSPCLKPLSPIPPIASYGTAECHPPSSSCWAVRDTPNQVREQIQLKNGEVESFQDGSNQWKGGRGAEAIVVPGYFILRNQVI